MSGVHRLVLVTAALIALCLPAVVVAESLGVGSWGMTGITVAIALLVTLIDREGFYGPRDPPPQ
jgi:hypothetical protein